MSSLRNRMIRSEQEGKTKKINGDEETRRVTNAYQEYMHMPHFTERM
jgi:hypothetical protein